MTTVTCVGAFTGLKVRRLGVPILGSPFKGWMTGPMGFDLDPAVPRREAARGADALRLQGARAACTSRCSTATPRSSELDGMSARLAEFHTYELDLGRTRIRCWRASSSSCRRNLRKSEREGVTSRRRTASSSPTSTTPSWRTCSRSRGINPPTTSSGCASSSAASSPPATCLMLRASRRRALRSRPASSPPTATSPTCGGSPAGEPPEAAAQRGALLERDPPPQGARHPRSTWAAAATSSASSAARRSGGIPFVRKSRVPGLMALRDAAARFYWRRAVSAVVAGAGFGPDAFGFGAI